MEILVVIFAVLLLWIGLYFVIPRFKREYKKLGTAGVKMSFLTFLIENIKMAYYRIPPKEIFRALREAKELKVEFEIAPLKILYRNISKKFSSDLKKFNKSLLERELRLKRFWSHYLLGGDTDKLARLIIESKADGSLLKIKGSVETDLGKENEKYLNDLIEKTLKNKDELPKLPELSLKKSFIVRNLYKVFEYIGFKKKIETDDTYKKFISILKSELKDGKIKLSKEDSVKELENTFFKDTYEAFYNSKQSGLLITIKHIDAYIEKNIDIKKILELLNKLHEFDKLLRIEDLEKFITLKSGENERIITSLIHAKKHNIPIDYTELWEYRLRGGNMSIMLEAYITAHVEGLRLEIPKLTKQVSLRRNVEELVKGLIILYQERIDLSMDAGTSMQLEELREVPEKIEEALDILGEFQDIIKGMNEKSSGNEEIKSEESEYKLKNIGQFVTNLIKASHLGLYFSYKGLKSYHANGGRIDKLMDVLIEAQQANLDITFDDCMQLVHSKGRAEDLLSALKVCKRANSDIKKERLMNLQRVGGDMVKFATAYDLSIKLGLNIKPEELEADLIDRRNVLDIIYAIIYARNEGVKIDYHTSIKFDRIPNSNVPSRIRWAVDPQIFRIEPIAITTKDTVEVKLKVNATVRGKYMLYTQGNRDEIFTTRVKEALVKEVERYTTFNNLVESLNLISSRLYLRLTAKISSESFPEMDEEEVVKANALEEKQNSISAFEILDINIPGLEIDNEALFTIRKEQAELEKIIEKAHSEKRRATAKAMELEAKAKLIDSEAEINLGMAEAFRTGAMTAKDLLKKKIFEDSTSRAYDKSSEHD